MEMSKAKVVDIPQKGFGIILTKDVKKDEVLFKEEPICSAQMMWGKKLNYSVCSRCMLPLETKDECITRLTKGKICSLPKSETDNPSPKIVRCRKSDEKFCCEECKHKADMDYGRLLLPAKKAIDELDDLWRDMHFPPESASIALVYRLLAMRRLDPVIHQFILDKEERMNGTVVADEDNLVHKMLGEKFERDLMVLTALLTDIFEDCNEDEVKSILKILGSNQQGIGTSALTNFLSEHDDEELVASLYDTIDEVTGNEFMDNEGVGLYNCQSMLNHSCRPNARIAFNNNNHTLSVVMIDDVGAGSEVNISYIDECQLECRSKKFRQTYLMDNYLFKCYCPLCEEQAGTSDISSDEEEDSEEDDEDFGEPESFS